MELSLFDLHCDTAYEMHQKRQSLSENSLAVSLKKAACFDRYAQIMALWTDHRLSDEDGWNAFENMYSYLQNDISNTEISLSPKAPEQFPAILLGVEDARILANRLERVDRLWEMGIRFLTPLWKGETCIGGSHDTQTGLTAFGNAAIKRAIELGMIADISHASEQSSYDMFDIGAQFDRPIIATHSNSHEVCAVSRNLRKWQADAILQCGGIIGLNLYPPFIHFDGTAHLQDLIPHIEYFLSLGWTVHPFRRKLRIYLICQSSQNFYCRKIIQSH